MDKRKSLVGIGLILASTVPGAVLVQPSNTIVENTLHRLSPRVATAAGHGIRPRT